MARRTISRRSRDENAYEDEPRSSRKDADEDDRPSRGRSRRDDRDEEPPRGRTRRTRDEEPEDEPRGRSRRSRDADPEEDDRPRRSRRDSDDSPREGSRRPSKSTVGKGWGGYDEVKGSGSDYVNTWKLPTKATLIKILDAEPFTTYAEHWLDEITKGKRSFVCLGEDCPLCDDLGDRPSGYALFNILDLTNPDNPKVEVWKAGKRVAGMLKNYSDDKKTSPLNREDLYWSIFKSGEKGGNVQTNLNPVKARDLLEDWDVDPFTDDELDEFEKDLHVEEDVVYINSRKDLKEVAENLD